jgi:hypothetical protein
MYCTVQLELQLLPRPKSPATLESSAVRCGAVPPCDFSLFKQTSCKIVAFRPWLCVAITILLVHPTNPRLRANSRWQPFTQKAQFPARRAGCPCGVFCSPLTNLICSIHLVRRPKTRAQLQLVKSIWKAICFIRAQRV